MGYGLREAKAVSDAILDKETICLQSGKDLESFCQELVDIGTICNIEKMVTPFMGNSFADTSI